MHPDDSRADALTKCGVIYLNGPFAREREALDAAEEVLEALDPDPGFPPLAVIGDFIVPPPDAPPSRDFQTLHFDFGLPVEPMGPGDVARYTALHVPPDRARSGAVTRLVPLVPLLASVCWPDRTELLGRLVGYGRARGARVGEGYVEGSFARLVEAAAGGVPELPSVRDDPDFLCGNEFRTLEDELDFFRRHRLSIPDAQIEIDVLPGDVAIFDNLALVHGRIGTRQPGELRQYVFGHRALDPGRQCTLRDRVLARFGSAQVTP